MRIIPDSGTRLLRGQPHWLRCAFEQTALVDDIVTLAPLPAAEAVSGETEPFAGGFAGLAFDPHCRLFHPLPGSGELEYVLWGQQNALAVHEARPQPAAWASENVTKVEEAVTREASTRLESLSIMYRMTFRESCEFPLR